MINVLIATDPGITVDHNFLTTTIQNKLSEQGVDAAEVSLSIVDAKHMQQICKQFMDDGLEHDVLSFPLFSDVVPGFPNSVVLGHPIRSRAGFDPGTHPDNILRLGDIVVSYAEVLSQAKSDRVSTNQKLAELIEHGVMHLLGHHHDDNL